MLRLEPHSLNEEQLHAWRRRIAQFPRPRRVLTEKWVRQKAVAPARDHAVMGVHTWFGEYVLRPWKPK